MKLIISMYLLFGATLAFSESTIISEQEYKKLKYKHARQDDSYCNIDIHSCVDGNYIKATEDLPSDSCLMSISMACNYRFEQQANCSVRSMYYSENSKVDTQHDRHPVSYFKTNKAFMGKGFADLFKDTPFVIFQIPNVIGHQLYKGPEYQILKMYAKDEYENTIKNFEKCK